MIRTFFITEFELNTLFGEILNNLLTMHPNLNLRQRLFEQGIYLNLAIHIHFTLPQKE